MVGGPLLRKDPGKYFPGVSTAVVQGGIVYIMLVLQARTIQDSGVRPALEF